jgi:hypothetical protein
VPGETQVVREEALHLATVREYGILDHLQEDCVDHLASAAAALLAAPIGIGSLVVATRVWFKARVGIDATETRAINLAR